MPVEYRRIVGLIQGDTHPDNLRVRLSRFSLDETLELLDELVDRGHGYRVDGGQPAAAPRSVYWSPVALHLA